MEHSLKIIWFLSRELLLVHSLVLVINCKPLPKREWEIRLRIFMEIVKSYPQQTVHTTIHRK